MQLDNDLLFNELQPSGVLQEDPRNQRYFGDEIENENSFVLPATAHFGNNLLNHGNTQGRKAQLFYDDGTMMGHDETARNLIADVDGGNISPIAGGRAAGPLQKP